MVKTEYKARVRVVEKISAVQNPQITHSKIICLYSREYASVGLGSYTIKVSVIVQI